MLAGSAQTTQAVVVSAPGELGLATLPLRDLGAGSVTVDVLWSGISTGTERLMVSGRMPHFPGMGYPLVPGYEAVGQIVANDGDSGPATGSRVFIPGANCFEGARGLFGGAAARLIVPADRCVPVPEALGPRAILLALAATAHHAAPLSGPPPELIVGHGVLGRLVARLAVIAGGNPTVWETNTDRHAGAQHYHVTDPANDDRRDYSRICDVSGDAGVLDTLIARLAKGGEITLAGFYAEPLRFAFPPAFIREARLRVAAEWAPSDLEAVSTLVAAERLSLDGLITHGAAAQDARDAYRTAFDDPRCLKMILDWSASA